MKVWYSGLKWFYLLFTSFKSSKTHLSNLSGPFQPEEMLLGPTFLQDLQARDCSYFNPKKCPCFTTSLCWILSPNSSAGAQILPIVLSSMGILRDNPTQLFAVENVCAPYLAYFTPHVVGEFPQIHTCFLSTFILFQHVPHFNIWNMSWIHGPSQWLCPSPSPTWTTSSSAVAKRRLKSFSESTNSQILKTTAGRGGKRRVARDGKPLIDQEKAIGPRDAADTIW